MAEEAQTAPAWVPFADSIQWMAIEGETCKHVRPASGLDTARGVAHIKDGHWRLEFRVKCAAHSGGVILGVADVDSSAWSQKPKETGDEDDGKKGAAKKDAKGAKKGKDAAAEPAPSFKPGKPAVAWGLCSLSGSLITTHHPNVGRYGGARIGEQLMERRSGGVSGMTVVIECDIPCHRSQLDAMMARRSFMGGCHPLDVPRDFPLHMRALSQRTMQGLTGAAPVAKPASLAFRFA